jgi:ArsR family transcriptional regulator, arsenate/arsenite/antimonite-responsive transcriptional repressor
MKTKPAPPAIEVLFKALSDRTRIRLLHLLLKGEVCVCDLVTAVELPQPTVSRHLAYLRRARLVLARKDGQWAYYRLAPARGAVHAKLIECLHVCCKDLPVVNEDSKRVGKKGCC